MVPSRAKRRSAFTLLELMLVLALLSAMAAMTWPMMHGALSRQRLQSGAEQIRAAWMNARVDAMVSGLIHVFRYDAASGRYWVEMWEGFDADLEASGVGGSGAASSQADGPPENAEMLSEGVSFLGGEQDITARDEMSLSQAGESAAGDAVAILFYPDGTTSNVTSFALAHEAECTMTLSMHGLTGIVSISRAEATGVRE
jgi:prepilin-type N-terminal cleavage/methylation domain-containing protein